jgi:hypothetical protein
MLDRAGARAIWLLKTAPYGAVEPRPVEDVIRLYEQLAQSERERRAAFANPLDRAADAYLVQREAAGPSSPAKPPAHASASAWTTTACWRLACPACS